MHKTFMTKSRLCGLLCVLIGAAAAVTASRFQSTGLLDTDPGPALFPLIGGIGLILCGAIIFLQNNDDAAAPGFGKEGLLRIGKCAVLLVAYMLGLKYIGFLISTLVVLFLFCGMFTFGKSLALWKRIVYTVLVTGAVYYVFAEILHVMLPRGILL